MTRTTALLTSLTLAGLAGSAQASTVLFADTFNRADNTDLNAATTGKTGTLGALTWNEKKSGGEPQIISNTLRLGETGGGGGGFSLAYANHNFTDSIISTGGEFTVTVDLGSAASGGGTRFTGFAVGNSKTELDNWATSNPVSVVSPPSVGFTSDFFIGYDPTNTTEVKIFRTNQQVYQQTINLNSGAELSVRFFDFSDFNANTVVKYEASINGGSAITGSFFWSGTNENYIALFSNYTLDRGTVDSFEVSAVPEPGSLALLGLGGLLVASRRRRD